MRGRLLPAVFAVVSLAAGAFAWYDPGVAPEASTASASAPDVPLLSPRRAPETLRTTIADLRLQAALDAVLADPALGPAREHTCLIVQRQGRRIHAVRPDASLIPASNLKLLTALAALELIGPETRFTTEVRRVGDDLWLVGGGDALLATADYAASFENQPQLVTPLEELADAVVAAGVTVVPGMLRGDESRYDRRRYVASWKPGYIADNESGPASALTVNDGFTRYRPRRTAADAPATHAAATLAALLEARGVRVVGGVGEGDAPERGTVVARIESPPVREVVGQMLRESDNLTAELLVKELGVRAEREGTTEAGLRVLRETLARAGLPVEHLSAADGSGLDRSDRASCTLVFDALARSGPTSAVAAGLPVAAKDGTLAKRFHGHPAAGRLRAKTGSLNGVTALSGWVDDRLAFALIANELPRESVGLRLQEAVAAVLARYPDAPSAEELAP